MLAAARSLQEAWRGEAAGDGVHPPPDQARSAHQSPHRWKYLPVGRSGAQAARVCSAAVQAKCAGRAARGCNVLAASAGVQWAPPVPSMLNCIIHPAPLQADRQPLHDRRSAPVKKWMARRGGRAVTGTSGAGPPHHAHAPGLQQAMSSACPARHRWHLQPCEGS